AAFQKQGFQTLTMISFKMEPVRRDKGCGPVIKGAAVFREEEQRPVDQGTDRFHFEGDHRQSLEALFLERGWVESRDTLPSVRGQDALPAIALNPVLIRNELRGENGRRLREFLSPENPDGIRLLDPSIDDAGHTVLRFIEEPTDPFRPNYASAVLSPDGSVLVAHPLR
ncbi:MAG: hypothetical protein AAFX94_12230, partial [Myxococcota bacterium]